MRWAPPPRACVRVWRKCANIQTTGKIPRRRDGRRRRHATERRRPRDGSMGFVFEVILPSVCTIRCATWCGGCVETCVCVCGGRRVCVRCSTHTPRCRCGSASPLSSAPSPSWGKISRNDTKHTRSKSQSQNTHTRTHDFKQKSICISEMYLLSTFT